MAQFSRIKTLGSLILAASLASGCVALVAGAVVGTGAIAYSQGELRSVESAGLDRTFLAAIGATTEVGFQVSEKRKDAFFGTIDAKTARDKTVKIVLHKRDATATEVRIRVGLFGDEQISRELLAGLRQRL